MLKKYSEFVNEKYTEEEFLVRKDEILQMQEIIMSEYKKHHVDLKKKDIVITRQLNKDQESIIDNINQKDYDVFFKIFFDHNVDVGIDYLREHLAYFMPTARIYYKKKEKDYLSQMYIIALNYDETMNDNTYKSHIGITKYEI